MIWEQVGYAIIDNLKKIPAKLCWFTRPDHIPAAGKMVQDHSGDSNGMVSPNAEIGGSRDEDSPNSFVKTKGE